MSRARSLVEQHLSNNQNMVEFQINEYNKKEVMPLFNEFKQMGLSPELEERNSEHYLVVNISKVKKENNNVLIMDLSRKEKQEANLLRKK